MIKIVFFDVSGTLVKGNGTSAGAEFLGKGNVYRELDEQYKKGEIPIEELLTRTFACWKGLETDRLQKIYKGLGYNSGVQETIEKIRRRGIKIALLTNIPTKLAKIFAKDLKADYITGTRLEEKAGIFTGRVLELHSNKVQDAMSILKKENISPNEAICVGDRKHDAEVFKKVRFGVAFGGDEIARRFAKYRITDFRDLIGIIDEEGRAHRAQGL